MKRLPWEQYMPDLAACMLILALHQQKSLSLSKMIPYQRSVVFTHAGVQTKKPQWKRLLVCHTPESVLLCA